MSKRINFHGMWMLPRGRESRHPRNWLLKEYPHIHPSLTTRQRHLAIKRKCNRVYNAEMQWCREPGEGMW